MKMNKKIKGILVLITIGCVVSLLPVAAGASPLTDLQAFLQTNLSQVSFAPVAYDELWTTNPGGASVIGLYKEAYLSQTVGYNDPTFNPLFSVPGGFPGGTNGFLFTFPPLVFSYQGSFTQTTPFTFGLSSSFGPESYTWSSDSGANSDALDHMLTLKITGSSDPNYLPFVGSYLLAWEDRPYDTDLGSLDFNDMLVLVQGAAPVPVPTTLLLFSSGLVSLFWFRRKRK